MGSMGMRHVCPSFRLAIWNAHSVYNKRPELEALLHAQRLNVLCVAESWLRPADVWEIPGFASYRSDRLDGQGGGALILVGREFQVSRVVVDLSRRRRDFDGVGIVLATARGPMAILCVYAPPGLVIDREEWSACLDMLRPFNEVFLCGDFNAHHVIWGCSRTTPRGAALYELSLEHDLISINDSNPTYVPGLGSSPSNIDLIFCPLAVFSFAKIEVIDDPYGSDHLPVVLALETGVSAEPRPTSRINIGDVTWSRFHELL